MTHPRDSSRKVSREIRPRGSVPRGEHVSTTTAAVNLRSSPPAALEQIEDRLDTGEKLADELQDHEQNDNDPDKG